MSTFLVAEYKIGMALDNRRGLILGLFENHDSPGDDSAMQSIGVCHIKSVSDAIKFGPDTSLDPAKYLWMETGKVPAEEAANMIRATVTSDADRIISSAMSAAHRILLDNIDMYDEPSVDVDSDNLLLQVYSSRRKAVPSAAQPGTAQAGEAEDGGTGRTAKVPSGRKTPRRRRRDPRSVWI